MKNLKYNLEPLIPALLTILYTVTIKIGFSSMAYCVMALLSAIYFFPLRLLLFRKEDKTKRERALYYCLNIIYSIIIGISILLIILREGYGKLDIVISAMGLLLIVAMFILYIKYQNYREFVMCLLFSLLINAVANWTV